jgi:hypothetical protein
MNQRFPKIPNFEKPSQRENTKKNPSRQVFFVKWITITPDAAIARRL